MTTIDMVHPQSPEAGIEVHIWYIDLDQDTGNHIDLLSLGEVNRAKRFALERDQKRFVRTRVALRTILGNRLGISGALLEFDLGRYGKPFIRQPESNLEFNLTHCSGKALLAISNSGAIGIDLEQISSRPSQLKIAKRMFPEPVYKELSALPVDQLGAAFMQNWTEFEARAKLHGAGIFSAMVEQGAIHVTHFSPQPGWIACIATGNHGGVTVELKHFNFGEALN